MKTWNVTLKAIALALALFGCSTLPTISSGSREAKLALPACPPDQVTLDYGWSGPHPGQGADGHPFLIYAMTADDRAALERWMDQWRRCAHERGVVIEEANK